MNQYLLDEVREVVENHFSDIYTRDDMLSHFPSDSSERLEESEFVCRIVPDHFKFTDKSFSHISPSFKVVTRSVSWIDFDGDMWDEVDVCDVYYPNFINV